MDCNFELESRADPTKHSRGTEDECCYIVLHMQLARSYLPALVYFNINEIDFCVFYFVLFKF